jgi:hypothetical protein
LGLLGRLGSTAAYDACVAEPTTRKPSRWPEYLRDLADYLLHVWKHWRSLIIGGVGGILTVLALVTSFLIPPGVGIAILIVGLFLAQFLAFRDMKQERDELRQASEVAIGPSQFPRSPLERAVVESLTAAQKIERERLVQGDAGLFDRLIAWAGETDERLREAQAGKLHAQFREDGLHPPHGTNELVAYLKRQIGLLERALRQLRSDERSDNPGNPAAVVDRVARLREQYKRGRALQAAPPGITGPAPASQAGAQQGKTRKRAATLQWAEPTWSVLREHFPPREDDFCPCGVRWGYGSFNMAFDEELDAIGSADAYLEQKLAFLADLLKEHDS